MLNALILATLFGVKHLIGDYLLQLNGQSGRKRLDGIAGLKALFVHSLYHGFITDYFMCCYFFFKGISGQWQLILGAALFDFGTHFAIDFTKVKIEKNLNQQMCWYKNSVGLYVPLKLEKSNVKYRKTILIVDQVLHFLVYCVIILFVTKYTGVG